MNSVIRIIESYLKRFPVEEIKKSLVQCVEKATFEEPIFKPRKKKRVVALSLAAGIALLAGFGTYAWSSGLVYKTILAEQYGALKFQIRFPSSIKDADDILVRATVFVHDREEFPPADTGAIRFTNQEDEPDPSAYRFVSNTVYLKPGTYRAKITAEQRIYWYSFTLEPYAARNRRSAGEQKVDISFDRVALQPLSVRTEAYDAVTDRTITAATRYSVLSGNSWIPVHNAPEGTLQTGQVLKFKAEHDGYYDELFSLKIAPYQTELVLHANLIPLPGTLSLEAPQGEYRILLDGSSSFIRGGEVLEEDSFTGYSGGKQTWELPSGRYTLEIISEQKTLQTRMDIIPGETTKFTIHKSDGQFQLYKE